MHINRHIERLVLDGLSIGAHDQPALQAAVQAQLAMMLSTKGLPASAGLDMNAASLAAPSLRLGNPADARTVGTGIGEAIYGGLVARRE